MHLIAYLTLFSVAVAFVNCYKATVVEHIPSNDDNPSATIDSNLKTYVFYIGNAKKSGSDIIVFPEYGLTHLLSKDQLDQYAIQIKTNLNSEMEPGGHLRTLSNTAKENRIYVVVNFIEKEIDSKNVAKLYNTNVVFDRNGNIVAKYRKINLYDEDGLTRGNQGNVTFTTDFGVKFGLFSSYDILFENPSRLILKDNNVNNIIYPSYWPSKLPIYVSTAIQHGYVKSTGVNLLAASLNLPSVGASGSGIFEATGEIKTIEINGASKSIDKVETVTEYPKRLDSCDVNQDHSSDNVFNTFSLNHLIPDVNDPDELNKLEIEMHTTTSNYKYSDLDLSSKDVHKEVCYDSFCCTFNIRVNNYVKDEYFKLATYRDTTKNKNVYSCLLLHCANEDLVSCGSRSNSNTTFSRIEVFGKFNQNGFYQPYGLKYNYKPIDKIYYCNKKVEDKAVVKLSTNVTENLIAIGLMGVGAGSGTIVFNIFLLFVVIYNVFNNLV